MSQLVAHATAGASLDVERLQESTEVWCELNGAQCSADECMRIAHLSEDLALEFAKATPMQDLQQVRKLFTDGWRLDYGSPLIRGVFDVCRDRLL